jgi:hypothetical protein
LVRVGFWGIKVGGKEIISCIVLNDESSIQRKGNTVITVKKKKRA